MKRAENLSATAPLRILPIALAPSTVLSASAELRALKPWPTR